MRILALHKARWRSHKTIFISHHAQAGAHREARGNGGQFTFGHAIGVQGLQGGNQLGRHVHAVLGAQALRGGEMRQQHGGQFDAGLQG